MDAIRQFAAHMNWQSLLLALLSAAATLLCFTVHELCHGLTAWRLGDPTAKNAGRLTLNPLKHIDWLGLLLMLTAHVGWAKPVPVDMRNFKRPKAGMALTALAGPVSNFLLAWIFMLAARLLLALSAGMLSAAAWAVRLWYYALVFFLQAAYLSVGLGAFNLIPIPPLDGSKVLFSFLPDRIYYAILRYERYIMLALFLLLFTGVLRRPLAAAIGMILRGLCVVSGLPFPVFSGLFGL